MKKCPECGSEKILQNAQTDENSFVLFIKAFGNPDAAIFRDAVRSRVKTKVCVECGYVQFYAVNLPELGRIYRIEQERYNANKLLGE